MEVLAQCAQHASEREKLGGFATIGNILASTYNTRRHYNPTLRAFELHGVITEPFGVRLLVAQKHHGERQTQAVLIPAVQTLCTARTKFVQLPPKQMQQCSAVLSYVILAHHTHPLSGLFPICGIQKTNPDPQSASEISTLPRYNTIRKSHAEGSSTRGQLTVSSNTVKHAQLLLFGFDS